MRPRRALRASLPTAPLDLADLERMKRAVLLGDEDLAALRRSLPILEPQVDRILDVWYGFVGAHDFPRWDVGHLGGPSLPHHERRG